MKGLGAYLCTLGSIVLASALLILYVFTHTPYPWGTADTPLTWLGDDSPLEKTALYQVRVYAATIGAAAVGIGYFFIGATFRLASYLKTKL